MDEKILQKAGLTQNEVLVYITLLREGKAHVGTIARKTGLHRRTIYDCVERLLEKGLAGSFMADKCRYFNAAPPEKIMQMLKEKEEAIQGIIPDLNSLFSQKKEDVNVSSYKGKEGLKMVCEDIIKLKPKVLFSLISSGEEASKVLPYFIPQWHKKRIDAKIMLRGVISSTKEGVNRAKNLNRMEFTKAKLIDADTVVPISIWTYNNFVALMMWENELAIVIESKEVADSFRKHFEELWKIAK